MEVKSEEGLMLASGQLERAVADNDTQADALLRRMEMAGVSPLLHQIGSGHVAENVP